MDKEGMDCNGAGRLQAHMHEHYNLPTCMNTTTCRYLRLKPKVAAQFPIQHVAGDYSVLLSRSRYCLVMPGDGWSARAEDSVLHGCVPVVIMDQVRGKSTHTGWE